MKVKAQSIIGERMEKVIANLVETELDENCHGNDHEGNVTWADGAQTESYGEYIREHCHQEGHGEISPEEVQEIWDRVLAATSEIILSKTGTAIN